VNGSTSPIRKLNEQGFVAARGPAAATVAPIAAVPAAIKASATNPFFLTVPPCWS
jgi:hypothetical protein